MTQGPPPSPPTCHYYGCRYQIHCSLMTELLFTAIQAVYRPPVDLVLETSSLMSVFMTGQLMTSGSLRQVSVSAPNHTQIQEGCHGDRECYRPELRGLGESVRLLSPDGDGAGVEAAPHTLHTAPDGSRQHCGKGCTNTYVKPKLSGSTCNSKGKGVQFHPQPL